MTISDQELWEARRQSAKDALNRLVQGHAQDAREAKSSVVYMDACPAKEGVHPAVALVEETHFTARQQDALFHQGQAQKYLRAIETIEAMTYEESK